MRVVGCEPFIRETNAKIARRWLKKMENTMDDIPVPGDIRGGCAT
jgi:truncated hemoglobin YjbI